MGLSRSPWYLDYNQALGGSLSDIAEIQRLVLGEMGSFLKGYGFTETSLRFYGLDGSISFYRGDFAYSISLEHGAGITSYFVRARPESLDQVLVANLTEPLMIRLLTLIDLRATSPQERKRDLKVADRHVATLSTKDLYKYLQYLKTLLLRYAVDFLTGDLQAFDSLKVIARQREKEWYSKKSS